MVRQIRITMSALALAVGMLACNALFPAPTLKPAQTTPTLTQSLSPITPPTSTLSAPTYTLKPTRASTSTATSDCDRDEILVQLRSSMSYAEFAILHNTLNEPTLVFWIVDPDLDPLAQGEAIAINAELALDHLIQVAHQLNQVDLCVEDAFMVINGIVVDRKYNGWVSGNLSPKDLPDQPRLTEEKLLDLRRKMEIGYLREVETPPISHQAAPANACSWPEAEEKIWYHFARTRPNVAFHYVIDEVEVNVWAQWNGFSPLDGEFASLLNVSMEVQCLYPPLDWLWVIVVDDNGNILFIGRVPGKAVRDEDYSQVINQLEVLFNYK